MFSTVGGYHDARGDIMNTMEGVQYHGGYHPLKFEYRGGYHDACGGYHEYRGGYHDACGGYHEYRGDIMSTVGVFSAVGYSNNN